MSDIISGAKSAVQEFAAIRGNKRRLARAAGLPESTLTGVDCATWNPKTETLIALHKAMAELQRGKHPGPLGQVA
jgi:hypothetical protein